MARTKVNKSKAIREALAAHKGKSPKEIAELVTKGGVKVDASYVSNIKATMGKKKKSKKGKPGRKAAAPASNGHTDLGMVFEFVQKVGGVSKAKSLLDDFAGLLS